DDDLQAREWIARGKIFQQRYAKARVRCRRQRERQRRQRARLDLLDVRERLTLVVQHFLGKAQQADARLRELRRRPPAQEHGPEAMLKIGYRLAYGRLRQVEALCRAAEAARLDHRLETAQFVSFNLHAGAKVRIVWRFLPSVALIGASPGAP